MTRLALPAILAAGLTMTIAGPAMAAVPTNDDFANATVVSVTPFTDAINTADATSQATDSTGCGGSHSVWYAYTASHNGTLTFDTFGSSFDTLLSAYTGTEGSLTQVACNDDANSTPQSQVSFDVTSGTTYHFMVGGCCRPDDGTSGDLVVHADVTAPPFSYDVTLTAGSADPRTHEVTLSGTVGCTSPGLVNVAGTLEQRNARGSFSIEVACTPASTAFAAPVTTSVGAFMPGRATVTALTDWGCGGAVCASGSLLGSAGTTVKLHP
jgi:hypothetical protein